MGARLLNLENAEHATFAGAYYDDATELDPRIDASQMVYVPEPAQSVLWMAGVAGLLVCARARRVDPFRE